MGKLKSIAVKSYMRGRKYLSLVAPSVVKIRYQLPSVRLDSMIRNQVSLEIPILDDICLPPYLGSRDHDDLTPLMAIVKALEPRIVVELGTAHGNTVANICKQCPEVKVYTVNAPASEQTGSLITYVLTRDEIGRVYRKHGYSDQTIQIYENTLKLELANYLDGPVIDLAIIDACHDTNYVINDFHKVRPFLRSNGVILLHDTHPSMKDHLVGSYAACMKLRRHGYDIRHISGTWWGIWINDSSDKGK